MHYGILKVLTFNVKVSSNSIHFLESLKQIISAFQFTYEEFTGNGQYEVFVQNWGNENGSHRLIKNGETIFQTSDNAELLLKLLDFILEDFIESTKDHLLLHSAVLVKRRKAIVLPAGSNSGKTTLSLALLKDEFKYISDEVAAVNIYNLKASGFPRAMMIKDKTLSLFPSLQREIRCYKFQFRNSRDVQKAHLGIPGERKTAPLKQSFPITAIVFPKYNPDGVTTLTELKPSEALVNLMRCSFNHLRLNEIGFRSAAKIARKIKCYFLEVNDLTKACELINDLIESHKGGIESTYACEVGSDT